MSLADHNMSLLSQQDRHIVIAALENYIMKLRTEEVYDNQDVFQANALLNWIRLEYQKNV